MAAPLTLEERRRLVEAPFPELRVINSQKSHGGVVLDRSGFWESLQNGGRIWRPWQWDEEAWHAYNEEE